MINWVQTELRAGSASLAPSFNEWGVEDSLHKTYIPRCKLLLAPKTWCLVQVERQRREGILEGSWFTATLPTLDLVRQCPQALAPELYIRVA